MTITSLHRRTESTTMGRRQQRSRVAERGGASTLHRMDGYTLDSSAQSAWCRCACGGLTVYWQSCDGKISFSWIRHTSSQRAIEILYSKLCVSSIVADFFLFIFSCFRLFYAINLLWRRNPPRKTCRAAEARGCRIARAHRARMRQTLIVHAMAVPLEFNSFEKR